MIESFAGMPPLPPLEVIARYFPQFALAVYEGVEVRPNLRTLKVTFSTTALNTFLPASFDEQLGSFSLFSGVSHIIDPTSAFAGNPLKSTSDANQAIVSGVAMRFSVRGRGDDYNPVPNDTPLFLVSRVLNPSVGMWAWDMPDNVKATYTIIGFVPAAPFTVWTTFGFYVLASSGLPYLAIPRQTAIQRLVAAGVLPPAPASQ